MRKIYNMMKQTLKTAAGSLHLPTFRTKDVLTYCSPSFCVSPLSDHHDDRQLPATCKEMIPRVGASDPHWSCLRPRERELGWGGGRGGENAWVGDEVGKVVSSFR